VTATAVAVFGVAVLGDNNKAQRNLVTVAVVVVVVGIGVG
jgi:hypothetical protein